MDCLSTTTLSRRLSTTSSSSSATVADDLSEDDEQSFSIVSMKTHGDRIPLTVHEGDFYCPTLQEVNHHIDLLEKKRQLFNAKQLQQLTTESTVGWDRKKSLLFLATSLRKMGVVMAESLAFQTAPPVTAVSWLGTETDVQNYELCYQCNGLSVWKKDFGKDRVIVRGDFLIPVSPKQYCEYASNIEHRREWDQNVIEARKIEDIDDGVDIVYVSISRIATIYPRDYINMRVIKRLKSFGRPQRRAIEKNRCQNGLKIEPPRLDHKSSSDNSGIAILGNFKMTGGQANVGADVKAQISGVNEHSIYRTSSVDRNNRTPNGESKPIGSDRNNTSHQSHSSTFNSGAATALEHFSMRDLSSAATKGHDRSNLKPRIHISRHGCYSSCSCSIEHPEMPEQPGKVRADVKVACYLAQPLFLPKRPINSEAGSTEEQKAISTLAVEQVEKTSCPSGHEPAKSIYKYDSSETTLWSRVYMFSEVDPRGWLPSTMSKHLAARVLPNSVERIVTCMLDHYDIPWRNELVYDPDINVWKKCDNALEYCYLKYLYAVQETSEESEWTQS